MKDYDHLAEMHAPRQSQNDICKSISTWGNPSPVILQFDLFDSWTFLRWEIFSLMTISQVCLTTCLVDSPMGASHRQGNRDFERRIISREI